MCIEQCAEVPGHCQEQLTQTLIACLYKTFIVPNIGGPLGSRFTTPCLFTLPSKARPGPPKYMKRRKDKMMSAAIVQFHGFFLMGPSPSLLARITYTVGECPPPRFEAKAATSWILPTTQVGTLEEFYLFNFLKSPLQGNKCPLEYLGDKRNIDCHVCPDKVRGKVQHLGIFSYSGLQ